MTGTIEVSDLLTSTRWCVGVGVALILGHVVAGLAMGVKEYWARFRDSLAIGLIERLFFTIAVAFALPGVAAIMGAWVAAKMAAGWSLEKGENSAERKELKIRRFAALRGNLTSMAFATLGGLIARGAIRW